MKSPFQNQINSDYINTPHVIIRWEKTRAFLNNYKANTGLDIGDRTPFTDQLEFLFNCPFENTTFDLDEGKLEGEYDIVTAFEIIEHLFNPLHLLTEIAGILKDGGKLYLSTPKGKPYFLWSEDHFHEMRYDRIKTLINRAGFRIIRKKEIRIHPIRFYFSGFRPLLRLIYDKHLLLELAHE